VIFLPIVALVAGFLLAYYRFSIPSAWADYAAIAILAGLDALIGAVRARLENQFDEAVFVSGFFVNMGLAILLAYLGDKLGVDLYLAVVVALGIRIFTNLGRIRGLFVRARMEAHRARHPAGADLKPAPPR
jgi:small basic protein